MRSERRIDALMEQWQIDAAGELAQVRSEPGSGARASSLDPFYIAGQPASRSASGGHRPHKSLGDYDAWEDWDSRLKSYRTPDNAPPTFDRRLRDGFRLMGYEG